MASSSSTSATTASSTSSTTSSSGQPLPTASGTPSGCQTSYLGTFPITVVNSTSKRLRKRDEDLIISLTNGILKDGQNRTGYIASNDQFEFDSPVPADALYAAGWAVCPDSKVYLGSESSFNECLNGAYYDIYISSYNNGSSCTPIYLKTVNPGGDSNSSTTSSATASSTASASTGSYSPVPEATDSGLSTGAKAGIGVGAALGAVLLAGTAWFLIRNRRRGRKQVHEADSKVAEFPSDNKTQYELAPVNIYEADGVDRPLEMESTVRAELDSDWTGWEMPVQSERRGSEGVSSDVQKPVQSEQSGSEGVSGDVQKPVP